MNPTELLALSLMPIRGAVRALCRTHDMHRDADSAASALSEGFGLSKTNATRMLRAEWRMLLNPVYKNLKKDKYAYTETYIGNISNIKLYLEQYFCALMDNHTGFRLAARNGRCWVLYTWDRMSKVFGCVVDTNYSVLIEGEKICDRGNNRRRLKIYKFEPAITDVDKAVASLDRAASTGLCEVDGRGYLRGYLRNRA